MQEPERAQRGTPRRNTEEKACPVKRFPELVKRGFTAQLCLLPPEKGLEGKRDCAVQTWVLNSSLTTYRLDFMGAPVESSHHRHFNYYHINHACFLNLCATKPYRKGRNIRKKRWKRLVKCLSLRNSTCFRRVLHED